MSSRANRSLLSVHGDTIYYDNPFIVFIIDINRAT